MNRKFGVFAFSAVVLATTGISGSVAFAGQNDDLVARLNAAEQENAAIRRSNIELAAKPAKPASITDKMADFSGAYAADLPVAYKARPPVEPGRFTVWIEGGAIWTGGDSVYRDYYLYDFTTAGLGRGLGSIPGIFDLNPKIGWEAATGFDYKFAGSPWHVSGQFRYGQGGNVAVSANSSGFVDPTLLPSSACFSPIADADLPASFGNAAACGGSHARSVSYKETHWLSDLAVGYELAGHGPTYVQFKGGLRIEEFVATRTNNTSQTNFVNYTSTHPLTILNSTFTSASITEIRSFTDRMTFLGMGPLIGLEGSARFLGAWSFDYKGDLAVLFGTQKEFEQNISTISTSPALLGVPYSSFLSGGNASAFTDTSRFATMLSGDIQAGVSYWFTPNLKLGASYRIDGLVAVKNSKYTNASNLAVPDRFWHGPRMTLTGQF